MIPAELLPCIDDWDKLRVIADWLDDHGEADLAQCCRWTANEWSGNRGLRRFMVQNGMAVWARYACTGWSAAHVVKLTPQIIEVEFLARRGTPTGNYQRGYRAWWDLEPRGWWNDNQWAKPKKRNGYGVTQNAELARMLCGVSQKAKAVKHPEGDQAAPRLPFLDEVQA